jgi:sugar lactone lactonase YvrE
MSVRLGLIGDRDLTSGRGAAGFSIGVQGPLQDYRNNLIFGTGLDVGLRPTGELFIGRDTQAATGRVPLAGASSVELRLTVDSPAGGAPERVMLSAHDPAGGRLLAEVERTMLPAGTLAGNLALFANIATAAPASGAPPPGTAVDADRWWFADWHIAGSKVAAHPDRAFGPLLFSHHTLHAKTLTLTAQMPPLGARDEPRVRLQVQRSGAWTTIAEAEIHRVARTATFRVDRWNDAEDTPYRLAYTLRTTDGATTEHVSDGVIRRDPVDQRVLTVADTANALIRRISDLGVVSTLAGSPTARGNADGTGAAATFQSPRGLALDGAGNAYVADTQNHTIRRITSAGVVTTLAGAAGSPGSGDGSGSTARFNQPRGVAVAPGGDLYVADTGNNLIRRVTSAGVVTTVAGIFGISGSGDGAAAAASFNQPTGLATDESGNLYIADTGNSAIRRLAPDGQVTTLAGLPTVAGLKDGSGQEAWFNQPRDLIVLGQYLYVLDTGNAVLRRVTLSNQTVVTMTLAAGTGPGANPGFAPAPLPSNPSTPPPSSGGGGGGGAPSVWFMAALALMMFARRLQARA